MKIGSTVLNFAYDASGTPMAVTYGGATYYYATNIKGDVVAILNASGTAVVTYTYDAWGNILTTTGTLASTLGTHNPLRYRGYVYDPETGLYYLQSRYYNPTLGRFICADSLVSTGQGVLGNNMFAYCLNNPVTFEDDSGSAAEVCFGHTTRVPDVPIRQGGGGSTNYNGGMSSLPVSTTPLKKQLTFWEMLVNADEQVVLNAKHFAFYKGAPVIKVAALDKAGFSFGLILLGPNVGSQTVRHEYGHCLHRFLIGNNNYFSKVVTPSLYDFWSGLSYYDYYSEPQEYIADILGNVTRIDNNIPYQYNITNMEAVMYFIYSFIQ